MPDDYDMDRNKVAIIRRFYNNFLLLFLTGMSLINFFTAT